MKGHALSRLLSTLVFVAASVSALSVSLLATNRANHSTYGTLAFPSPDASQVFVTYLGGSEQLPTDEEAGPPQEANVLRLVGSSLQVYRTLIFDANGVYDGCLGGGASRSFQRFAVVDASYTATSSNLRVRVFGPTLATLLASRVFQNAGPSQWWKTVSQPSFTDDDLYLSLGLLTNGVDGATVYVLDAGTLATVVTLTLPNNGTTDGYFFTASQPRMDFLALGYVSASDLSASLQVYRFDRVPTPRLSLITERPLPQVPLSISVTPYYVPKTNGDVVRLIATTSQADVAGVPNLRQGVAQVESLIPDDGDEVRLYGFNGYTLVPLASEDTAADSFGASLYPGDAGNSLALSVAPEQSEYGFVTNTTYGSANDPSAAQTLRVQQVCGGTMKDVANAWPLGNQAHSIAFSVSGRFLITGNCKGIQNYNASSPPLFGGVWNNVGYWKVLP